MNADNWLLLKAMDRLARYSLLEQQRVKDLIQYLGAYYKKDVSEQTTIWAADLIDLDWDCLKDVIENYIRTDKTQQLPWPGKIRSLVKDSLIRKESSVPRADLPALTEQQRLENIRKIKLILNRIQRKEWINPKEFCKIPKCKLCLDTGEVSAYKKIKGVIETSGYKYIFSCTCQKGKVNKNIPIPLGLDASEWILEDWERICTKDASYSHISGV